MLSALILIMLTLVGYSSGLVLASRRTFVKVVLIDLLIVVVLWIVGFMFRESIGERLTPFIWLFVALFAAYTASSLRGKEPATELPPLPEATSPARGLWNRWVRFAAELGHFQSRMIMGFFYFTLAAPFAIAVTFFADFLDIKKAPSSTSWVEKRSVNQSLEDGRLQG